MSITSRLAALLLLGAGVLSAAAQTSTWPSRPVRLILPYGAGGNTDVLARTVAQKLSERWGQQVIVDNKPGGNTIIAAVEAMRAAPDGYTLFLPNNSTLTVNPFAHSKLPYDPLRDFTPVSQVTTVSMIWAASPNLPVKNLQEFVSYAKARPDEVTVGYAAVVSQVAVEALARDWDLKLRLIPYKSGVDITKGLLGDEIQAGFDGAAVYPPHVKSGKLRGLATTSSKRLEMFSGTVPTVAEQGLEKTPVPIWYAVMAPAGLPPALRDRIAADLKEVMAMPDVRSRLSDIGMEVHWAPPAEVDSLIRSESAAIGPLIKSLGIKIE